MARKICTKCGLAVPQEHYNSLFHYRPYCDTCGRPLLDILRLLDALLDSGCKDSVFEGIHANVQKLCRGL